MANYLILIENAKYRLARILESWEQNTDGAEADRRWRKLSSDLIVIAYARLFGQLDVESFWRGLASVAASGRTYLALRSATEPTRGIPASWNDPLLCAAACGDVSLAREIVRFFATERAEMEYDDEFQRAVFFRRLLQEDGPIDAALDRLRAASGQVEEELEEAPAFLDFFTAVGGGDARGIAHALEAWAMKVRDEIEKRTELPSAPPEAPLFRGLWLEGLAYLRLLERLGVNLPLRVPLVPGPVRNRPRGGVPSGLDLFSAGAVGLERL